MIIDLILLQQKQFVNPINYFYSLFL